MRAVLASHQANPGHTFIDKSSILAGAEMPIMINPARKHIVIDRTASPIEPSEKAGPNIWKQFELNRPTGFLLHHDCPRSNLPAADNPAH